MFHHQLLKATSIRRAIYLFTVLLLAIAVGTLLVEHQPRTSQVRVIYLSPNSQDLVVSERSRLSVAEAKGRLIGVTGQLSLGEGDAVVPTSDHGGGTIEVYFRNCSGSASNAGTGCNHYIHVTIVPPTRN